MSWASNHPSRGGASVGLTFSNNKEIDDEADRRLFNDLVEKGYAPDAAQFIVKKNRETGRLELDLPEFTNAAMPKATPNRPVPLPPVSDIPERSTLKNFGPMTKEAIGVYDYENPSDMSFVDVPKGTKVKTLVPTNRPKPGSGSKPPADPRTKIAQKLFMDYASTGFATDAQYEMMKTAAPFLGLSLEEIPTPDNPNPPGFFQKILGIKPEEKPVPASTYTPKFPAKGGKKPASKNGKPASYMEQTADYYKDQERKGWPEGEKIESSDSDDLETKAADFLKANGIPVTEANIKHAIKTGRVK